jgi:hypothetical protein
VNGGAGGAIAPVVAVVASADASDNFIDRKRLLAAVGAIDNFIDTCPNQSEDLIVNRAEERIVRDAALDHLLQGDDEVASI